MYVYYKIGGGMDEVKIVKISETMGRDVKVHLKREETCVSYKYLYL